MICTLTETNTIITYLEWLCTLPETDNDDPALKRFCSRTLSDILTLTLTCLHLSILCNEAPSITCNIVRNHSENN